MYHFRYRTSSKVSLEEDRNVNVDYIHCIRYDSDRYVRTNFKPLEVTETSIECNLDQKQRSSQQILDLADYFQQHQRYRQPIIHKSSSSFTSDTPLWIEFTNPYVFFDYLKAKFESNDVMVIWDPNNKPSNFNDIEEFCLQQNWRCTESFNVRGSEASVTILYNLFVFDYEHFTRAKSQLVIVSKIGG